MTRKIAFYLPQFHPVADNDAFWGKGFTEWTNVTKAKPLYKEHRQPFLPSDLGFYDLRLPEARQAQTELAQQAGIEGFCYWHYWFGGGKKVLDRILHEVLVSGEPDFPFCLAWANQSWTGKWHGLNNEVLFKQAYPGIEDIRSFFYDTLPAFKDRRYLKVDGKPLFLIYQPNEVPDTYPLIPVWRDLAKKEGINDIFFVGNDPQAGQFSRLASELDGHAQNGVKEAQYYASFSCDCSLNQRIIKRITKLNSKFSRQDQPSVFDYENYVRNYMSESSLHSDLFPTIIPGWDNTPRSRGRGVVFERESPVLFKELLIYLHSRLQCRSQDRQIIFLKSWNEWAEGNVLEPSERWGSQYLDAIRESSKFCT